MPKRVFTYCLTALCLAACSSPEKNLTTEAQPEFCQGYGPQAPRDVDRTDGINSRIFSLAPTYSEMNLCNIHFHRAAEHKAAAFSLPAVDNGAHAGYQCQISQSLTAHELTTPKTDVCGDLQPGDTIEVHWVHSSCDIKPGPGLESCSSAACANPDLRVETQVFTLVNDAAALDFADLSYAGGKVNGYHQAKALPDDTGQPVQYLGSTTGPKYDQHACSALQVSWSVRPQCAKLDINSLAQWCKRNIFAENHAHGVRKLVVRPELLSEIDPADQ